MITIKTVLKDKFWILQRDGASVGTMRVEPKHVSVVMDDQQSRYDSLEDARAHLGLQEHSAKQTACSEYQDVFGYPTDQESVYNVSVDEGRLPCFAKAKNSKVIHAAGWYGMHRNGLHAEAFCPKVNTLKSYPYIGPFRNQTDLRVAMIAWKRNDTARHNGVGQVLG